MNEQAGTAIGSGDGRLFVAPSPEDLNRVLAHFEVECLIGQGGMGAVYKARQPKLDRYVAVKVVPAFLAGGEHNFAERFEREARAMAGLNHPHIVTVHDFGETENGYLYIVMEYVDGRDMHHAIVSGRAELKVALNWMLQLCDAVQYAHDHDIVHRDIKPANILINKEGQVKVGDFGLVKLVGRKLETAITLSRVAMGTPDYSAPESLEEGGTVDHRVDVYSMGVLLYELLTGKVPRGAWKPPSAFARINPKLDQIVVKAMQPDPDQRYQSAAQLKEAILAVQAMGAEAPALDGKVAKAIPADRKSPATAKGVLAGKTGTEIPVKRRRRRGNPLAQATLALFLIGMTVGGVLILAKRAGTLQFLNLGRSGSVGEGQPQVPPALEARSSTPAELASRGGGEAAPALRVIRVEESWVDVIPTLEFPRDLVSGRWQVTDKILRPRLQKGTDRSRLRVPMLLDASFEVELGVSYQKGGVVPFVLTLPLPGGPVPLLIGEAGLPDEPPFLAIGGGGVLRNGKGEATRRIPVKLNPAGAHSLSVKVMNQNEQVGVLVALDGQEAGRFVGAASDFSPGGEAPSGASSRQLVFGADGDLEIRHFRVRSLPAKEWFPEPVKPVVARKGAAGGKPAAKAQPAPPPSPAEQERLWTEAVRQRISEVAANFEKREAEFVRTNYEVEVANLREKYNAALNREILPKDDSLSVKAAVQRELMRIRQGEHVEATDPPEMPDIVKKARAIYRQELSKLDEQLNLALAPLLREYLESLLALEQEKKTAGQLPGAAQSLLTEARGGVEQRLEGVRTFLSTLDKARKPAEPAGSAAAGPAQSATLKAEGPAPMAAATVTVPQKEKLNAANRAKGRLEIWPRTEVSRDAAGSLDWGEAPSGLGNSVVAVAGAPGVAVALKTNGRPVIWGTLVTKELEEQVGRLDGVADVTVSTGRTWVGLGFLMEAGTAKFLPVLTSLAPANPAEKAVSDLVELAVLPEAGVGLRQTGELVAWGKGGASYLAPGETVARIFAHGIALLALRKDGSVLSLGGGVSAAVPMEGPFQKIAIGTQPLFGMLAQRPDGSLAALGSFAGLQLALQTYSRDHKIVRFVAGYDAFAVQEERGGWAFFGPNLDATRLEKVAHGCREVVIGKDEVMGLQSM